MGNLLPLANSTLKPLTGGVYLGDGVPPVPAKLATKIRSGEFVDMGELLPEFWAAPQEEKSEGKRLHRDRRSRKVTDIFTWLQCFGAYVTVRAVPAPHLIPELMAYQATIVRVSQDYAGLAWVRYDAAFRRQAALTGNTQWSVVNSTLYTTCFTGMAATTKRCELCFATSHTEKECAQGGDPDPEMQDRLKALESLVLAMAKKGDGREQPAVTIKPSAEPCRNYNSTGCTYPRCRYSHTCVVCTGNHPATRCSMRGRLGYPAARNGVAASAGQKTGGQLPRP